MALVFGTAGAAATADNAAVTPTLPSGGINDVILCLTYGRGSGTLVAPTGYSTAFNVQYTTTATSTQALFYLAAAGGEGNPTVDYTGGSAGDDVIAQIIRVAGADYGSPIAQVGTTSPNGSAANIGAITGITTTGTNAVVVCGGRRDDWTSVATLSASGGFTYTEIGEPDTTTGNDAGMVWDYSIAAGATGNKTFSVTGGASNPGGGKMVEIAALPAVLLHPVPYIVNQASQRAATR